MKAEHTFLLVLICVLAGPVLGQSRSMIVNTNMASSNVFVDGEWLGQASQSPFEISADARRVTVSPAGGDAWSIEALSFDLMDESAAVLTLDARFPHYYRFETVPQGASVEDSSGSSMGSTPLTYVSNDPLVGQILLKLPGFQTASVTLGSEIWNRSLVELTPLPGMSIDSDGGFRVEGHRRRRWINYVAASTAVVGAVLSIHFRTKADNRFDDFSETGDRSLKSDIHRLDIYSGVAQGFMQVGVGVFAFRLAF